MGVAAITAPGAALGSLLDRAGDTPHAVACVDAATGRAWRYAELAAATRAFAAALAARPRGLVALLGRNDLPTVVGYLGALEAGYPVLLLDAALPAELQAGLDATYAFDHVVSPDGAAVAAALRRGDGRAPAAPHEPWVWTRADAAAAGPLHDDLAVLLSTSGSTGSPKLVRLSRRNVLSNAAQIAAALGIGPGERAAANLPLHYSYGLSVLNSHLAAGASVLLTGEGVVSPAFWAQCGEHGCTSMAGVPYSYQMLARLGVARLAPPLLRTFTQAGGKLAAPLAERVYGEVAAMGGRLFVMYGQTEATARIAVLPADLLPAKLGSAGRAVPGGALRVLRDDGTQAAPGEVGEIEYAGPNVMLGYAESRADLARGDTAGGRLATGDLGYLDADACLFVTGRLKRIAKLFGARVSLDEVEEMARRFAPSAAVAGDDRVVVFCEADDPQALARWGRELAAGLRVHHSGVVCRGVAALPTTASGKVDYPRLQAQAAAR
jgi:acyl-CoA synthetase (AMP-forming)/AMP-acid ligase II